MSTERTGISIEEQVRGFRGHLDPTVSRFVRKAASDIVNLGIKPNPGDNVLILYDKPGKGLSPLHIVSKLDRLCRAAGANTSLFEYNRRAEVDQILAGDYNPSQIRSTQDKVGRLIQAADAKIIVYGPDDPEAINELPEEKKMLYMQSYKQARWSEARWTIFHWPTMHNLRTEQKANPGMTYEQYLGIIIEGCNSPWRKIYKRQNLLAKKLSRATDLRFTARGTDVRMSLKGMGFAVENIVESGVNYPPGEVHSAPVIDSVEGILTAPGWQTYFGRWMRDITLIIEAGRIVRAFAKEGQEYLDDILNPKKYGEGVRFFGEIGIGTNPDLQKLVHDFYAEKTGLHMAVGYCHKDQISQKGVIKINNGNTRGIAPDQTIVHWDLPIPMLPENGGGKIIATYEDGSEEIIQLNGRFTDPKLFILNPRSKSLR